MKLFLILSLIAVMVGQGATVGTLRCEFLENPQGIDSFEPRLTGKTTSLNTLSLY